MSKGSKRRPPAVPEAQIEAEWRRIFAACQCGHSKDSHEHPFAPMNRACAAPMCGCLQYEADA